MGTLLDFMRKAKPERAPSEQPASPVAIWGSSQQMTVSYMESVAAELALKHPIIFRCLHKLGSTVSSVNWFCEVDPSVPVSEQAPARTIKAINALLQSPNDTMTRQALIYWMTLNFACYGRLPIKVGVSPVAPYVPTGIYPLTSRFFKSQRDNRGLVISYVYGLTENQETFPTRQRAAQGQSYAYEIIRPNMDGTFESKNNVNPLSAIGLPSQIVTLLLQRAVDTAAGHPNSKYIIVAEKTLTNPQKDKIKEQIEKSATDGEYSGQVLFLYNTRVDVVKLDNGLDDIHSKMPLDDMSRQIVGAFGIPIALIGLGGADAAKFANNYTESRRSFWEDTLVPEYFVPFATGMTAALCPFGARINFNYDEIQAILDIRIDNAAKLSKVNFLTRNEKRAMTGFQPLTAAEGGNLIDATTGSSATPPEQPKPSSQEQALQ